MFELHAELAHLFGFHAFRPHQEEVVRSVLAGRDTFTVMPTGGGKSLCYQLPARLLPGVCVVISPLLSLMKDQVDAARATGLAAAAYNSVSSGAEKNQVRRDLQDGKLELLYISPERLRLPEFSAFLQTLDIAFFAVDEAHCISEWGHDFRPDYLALASLTDDFPGVPLAAFTATATRRVEDDIIARLRLRDPYCTRASFNRPNLFYQVTPKENLEKQLLDFLREHQGESGIIYRTTRKNVESTTEFLHKQGIQAMAYHAGLGDAQRAAAQDAFREDGCPLIVATIAFGMGIDKSNVRFVIHADLPKNLEGYYQETGRAGRDGEPARCALFYGRKDIAQLMRFAEGMEDQAAREVAKTQLFRMLDFTRKEGCRRKALLAYFNEDLPGDNCGGCDVCTGEVEREDASVDAQKLLSAMVRTNCRFGAQHVISIVLGKDTKRIRDFGHNNLPTFGVGKNRDAAYWHRVMDALLAQGMAVTPDPSFPVPAVTEIGWEVLRGQRSCAVVRGAETTAKPKRGTRAADSPLFGLLREERTRLARAGNVPPYVVFSDRTLREMAHMLPDTPAKMLGINGVGEHKLATYGPPFLHLIQTWLEEHPDQRPAEAAPHAEGPRTVRGPAARIGQADSSAEKIRSGKGDTWRETARLLDEGLSLEQVAEARGLKPVTLYGHLEKLAHEGKTFPAERFIDPARLEEIRALFAVCGSWQLAPVVELSRHNREEGEPGGVSYDEARLARIFMSTPPWLPPV